MTARSESFKWYTGRDSNSQPSDPKSDALSSWVTGAPRRCRLDVPHHQQGQSIWTSESVPVQECSFVAANGVNFVGIKRIDHASSLESQFWKRIHPSHFVKLIGYFTRWGPIPRINAPEPFISKFKKLMKTMTDDNKTRSVPLVVAAWIEWIHQQEGRCIGS